MAKGEDPKWWLAETTYLNGVLVTEKVNNFESMGNDSDSHELLAVVASLHHQAIKRYQRQILYMYTVIHTCRRVAQQ